MKNAIITVGLGFGDEGKGTVVDYLCKAFHADLVVRYSGGHQCGHNVVMPDGRHHCFNLYGSGAFHGVPTYLGENVIVNLPTLAKEYDHLHNVLEVPVSGTEIFANSRALVCTPWFQIMNRAKEKINNHGSCGSGIGETRRYYLEHGRDSIFVSDLFSSGLLIDKLHLIKVRMIEEARKLGNLTPDSDLLMINEKKVAEQMFRQAQRVNLQAAYGGLKEFPDADTLVFEGAQGTLLDENFGFQPHTTWSTVTNRHAFEELEGLNYHTISLGLTRTYMTRHGAGPFPSGNCTDKLNFQEWHNPYNPWQGFFRQGPLDIPLLKYAVECNMHLDGLFVTHSDLDSKIPSYIDTYDAFPDGINNRLDLSYMARSAKVVSRENRAMADIIAERLGIPVVGDSFGPTYENKKVTDAFRDSLILPVGAFQDE